MNERTLKGRRVLIKNLEDGHIIADTEIIRFNSLTNSIYISAGSMSERKHYNIYAVIFAKECLYEFFGTIRGVMINNEIEVLLGKSMEKENRVKTRYPVSIAGNVDGIIIEGRTIRLRKSIYIQTINMSATGILIKADSGCFSIGDSFFLSLNAKYGEMQMDATIVRIQNSSILTEEYGCRIGEIWIERNTMEDNVR